MPGTATSEFTDLVNLADERLGAGAVAWTDAYPAPADTLLRGNPPEPPRQDHQPGVSWVDGWRTRRGEAGQDWCTIRLGVPGVVYGLVVDTSAVTDDLPEVVWVDGCSVDGYPSAAEIAGPDVVWTPVAAPARLSPGTLHRFSSMCDRRLTHLRLGIAPHGTVSRLRVHGSVVPDPRAFAGMPLDLAAAENGGVIELCSDMHTAGYADTRHDLIMPGPPQSATDGWRTSPQDAGHDWTVVRLTGEGTIRVAELDTRFLTDSAPAEFSLDCQRGDDEGERWLPLIGHTRLQPHTRHRFFVPAHDPVSRVRLNVYPHGGMGRLRLYGTLSPRGWEQLAVQRLNAVPAAKVERELFAVCGSRRWAAQMAGLRPFQDLAQTQRLARQVWEALPTEDCREAFRAHPRIGEPPAALWARREQADILAADPSVLDILAKANRVYEARFGYMFIAPTWGRDAQQLLDQLRNRLGHDPENELIVAAEAQALVLEHRLARMFRPE